MNNNKKLPSGNIWHSSKLEEVTPRSGYVRTGWYSGCMYDRWNRVKHKVVEPSFFFSRILPYEMQEWLDDSYEHLLPHGCHFGYTSKGYIQCINIPRKYDIDAVYKKFLRDVIELCEKRHIRRLEQGDV